MPPNLHTLPQDIVIIIIGFLARRFDVFDPEGELKEMCNYSLISRNFLYEAQKMLWINLTFGSNQSVLKWLESDATKRGEYRTVQLDLNHEIDELIIEKLLDSLNQSVSGLCLALTNSISSQVFQHNKLKGLKDLVILSPVYDMVSGPVNIPYTTSFQLERLEFARNFTGASAGEAFVTALFTQSLGTLELNPKQWALPSISAYIPSTKINLAISVEDIEELYDDLNNYKGINTLNIYFDLELESFEDIEAQFDEPLSEYQHSIRRLGLFIGDPDSYVLEELPSFFSNGVCNLLNINSFTNLEQLKIIHTGSWLDHKDQKLLTDYLNCKAIYDVNFIIDFSEIPEEIEELGLELEVSESEKDSLEDSGDEVWETAEEILDSEEEVSNLEQGELKFVHRNDDISREDRQMNLEKVIGSLDQLD